MIFTALFGSLAGLSLLLLLWQWFAAARFPLHARKSAADFAPPVTLLKSLKGCDAATEDCLRSWFTQDYRGPTQILFAVASEQDPVCEIVRKLKEEFPERDAELIIVRELTGANAKISKLIHLERLAKYDILLMSDADVRAPSDFLANIIQPLHEPAVGLVNCFYRLANPQTVAMQWEAIAINADFWSQVVQAKSLKPLDFALGAAIAVRRAQVAEIGGFAALANCLADDYELGNRIHANGHCIDLCPVVVECWDPPMNWRQVWKHQLRWARTIRVCQPAPFFFSLLGNAGWWALLWVAVEVATIPGRSGIHFFPSGVSGTVVVPHGLVLAFACVGVRILIALDLQRRLTGSLSHAAFFWLVPIKDMLQTAIWCGAFLGNTIEWRGEKFKLRQDGTLERK